MPANISENQTKIIPARRVVRKESGSERTLDHCDQIPTRMNRASGQVERLMIPIAIPNFVTLSLAQPEEFHWLLVTTD